MHSTQATSQTTVSCIQVGLAERSYPIYIGRQLYQQLPDLLPNLPRQICIVTNATVAAHYLGAIRAQLPAEAQLLVHEIADGEHAKSLSTYGEVMDTLIHANFNRDCAILALGGGVVGDLAGLVAATYQRGVDFYQLPTTLLAQVDSSVGGKTAINHPGGKNLIGAFYQPKAVVISTDCLSTLEARDFACGLAEIVKYGIIYDGDFFTWLEDNHSQLAARDEQALAYAIRRSCEIKAEIVAQDEREQGLRALLNLGHTFGHAIEAEYYDSWRHGEAVAAGTVIAAHFMQQAGELHSTDVERIERLLSSFELPTLAPQLSETLWQQRMQRDKKVQAGRLRLVLPTRIGAAELRTVTDWPAVWAAICRVTESSQ
ncbi:3-dehydroquinate synthase [Pseudidiomarina insulisalsae]|uniref:3-dehydroquinate synthase n=1 Tax=Pseudidiomarina insulisalsae TaxID=575789 RepID=A0A432YQT0_9GAMM|nr:3-dehydroquinate synthase [Pseudidiomarina insulisalsae]RUO63735.1 3-dehydroquinate synthase [Pseudidiomarina insulisalsae]